MTRQQRLVGGDHRFLRRQRRRDRGLGGIAFSAHQLDEDVDLAIGRERHRIGDPAQAFEVEVALLAARARGDRDDLDRPAAAGDERVALALDQPDDGGADRAQTGETESQRGSHRSQCPDSEVRKLSRHPLMRTSE